jgi:hypothetical protein
MSQLSLRSLVEEYTSAQAFTIALIDGLEGDEVFWRPNENSSAIAWHLGHQGAVNHFMVRNLTAAEVTFNADFDRVFDSATPEPARGELPALDDILSYRNAIAQSTTSVIDRIDGGHVGAPAQLRAIAEGLMLAVINHEYQHSQWISEVRSDLSDLPTPTPASQLLTRIDDYWMVRHN